MSAVTIAQVSAMINAAIILVQLTSPLAIVLVTLGLLQDRESATTWNQVSRLVQSSHWPIILNSDYSLFHGVRKRFSILSWILAITLILIAVAGVSTPLGLSESLQLDRPEQALFTYSRDEGPFGLGTPERSSYKYSRLCGGWLPYNCPGVDGGYRTWANASGITTTFNRSSSIIDLRIPKNVTEVFTSATKGTTISSIFDIQFRSYRPSTTANTPTEIPLMNNETYTVWDKRSLRFMTLNNKVELIEGLVVDTVTGGIGFRNHTIPSYTEFGLEWEEQLLWIEPVTECVDTNLTIEFQYLPDLSDDIRKPQSFLVDNGGLVNLRPEYPEVDTNDSQGDPQLYATAYRVAAFNNALTAAFFNLTVGRKDSGKVRLGARYNLTSNRYPYRAGFAPAINEIGVTPLSGSFLPLLLKPTRNQSQHPTDPSPMTSMDFYDFNVISQRFASNDVVNISTVGIRVGLLMGAPHLSDGSSPLIHEPWTNWTQNMIACASASRASVKTVRFSMSGTSLANVKVMQVSDKIYPDNASMPLWAIENSNLTVGDYSPLWGIVDDRYEKSVALQTRRKADLWLPAGQQDNSGSLYAFSVVDSNPSGAHMMSLSAAYSVSGGTGTDADLIAYSGKDNFALYSRWRDLSRSAETAPKIINLIWTDLMANTLVGTKSPPVSDLSGSYNGTVQIWKRHIMYDLRYAIPAIILLCIWAAVIIVALLLSSTSRVSLPALKQLINQLAPARMAINFLEPEICRSDALTREWAKKAGSIVVGFSRDSYRNMQKELESERGVEDHNTTVTTNSRSKTERREGLRKGDLRLVTIVSGHQVPLSNVLRRRRATISTIQESQQPAAEESSSLMKGSGISFSDHESDVTTATMYRS